MIIWLFTIVATTMVFGLVLWLLLTVKTPRYRVTKQQVQQLLEQVVVGQASGNDWAVFIGYQIRDNPELEKIRAQCVVIDEEEYRSHGQYLLTARGRDRVEALLRGLMNNRHVID
ncbi:hypothetical protein [Halioxenophilus aromaticivorans]|uniref:Uncharacterized protein n=1 Tax=Halioxenophilus aromaticivorans TaxID=1306992 RepID=A0AAV3U1F3_9ALTE